MNHDVCKRLLNHQARYSETDAVWEVLVPVGHRDFKYTELSFYYSPSILWLPIPGFYKQASQKARNNRQ